MERHPLIAEDCTRAAHQTDSLWNDLAGKRVFITGGTGFFGTWFLELLTTAIDLREIDCDVVVLSRDPGKFSRGPAGHLVHHRCIRMLQGDVCSFIYPAGNFEYVAHFGSTGPKSWHDADPLGFYDVVVNGTRRVLDFCVRAEARRFLLASSGLVYGNHGTLPSAPIAETYAGCSDPASVASANAESKRAAEFLTVATARAHPSLSVAIARGFAFIGPYMPERATFAAYDFIQDAISGRSLTINGDGTPVRSYLYGADLAIWLWTLLLRASENTTWNVGGEIPVSIKELAEHVAGASSPRPPVKVSRAPSKDQPAAWYVPNTAKARQQLGLTETHSLDESVGRTLRWYREITKKCPI